MPWFEIELLLHQYMYIYVLYIYISTSPCLSNRVSCREEIEAEKKNFKVLRFECMLHA